MLTYLRNREIQKENDVKWQLRIKQDFGDTGFMRFEALTQRYEDSLPFPFFSTVTAKEFYQLLELEPRIEELLAFQKVKNFYFDVELNPELNQWSDVQNVTEKMNILKEWVAATDEEKVDLIETISQHYWDIIQALTRNTYRDRWGYGILHAVTEQSYVIVLSDLLDAGADPNVLDDRQCTPLFLTMSNFFLLNYPTSKSYLALQYLVKAGIDPELQSRNGTALDHIKEQFAYVDPADHPRSYETGKNIIHLFEEAIRTKHEKKAGQEAAKILQQENDSSDTVIISRFKPRASKV